MTQLQLPIVEGVAAKLDRILAKVEGVRRGAAITRPTQFNAAGERHANRIAQQDRNPQ